MSNEAQYSSGADTTSNKCKYDGQTALPLTTRRPIGFSALIAPHFPDSAPLSYNVVAPPIEDLIKAKQRAQEVTTCLLISSNRAVAAAIDRGLDTKRPKFENGAFRFDSHNSGFGFSSIPPDVKLHTMSLAPLSPVSYGYQNASSSKKIDIPNGRVGLIIGKGGETIKYLQDSRIRSLDYYGYHYYKKIK